MRYYFSLQFLRLKRKISEMGFNLYIGLAIAIPIFIVLSELLFLKTDYAVWIYSFVAIYYLLELGNRTRNNSLKAIFKAKDHRRIRLIENLIILTPFLIFLIYQKEYPFSLFLLGISILLAFLNFNMPSYRVIPTPFKKLPFEFIRGFRKFYGIVFISAFLLIKAIQVDNYNLGLFALGLTALLGLSFIFEPENQYFVWLYKKNAKGFLWHKMFQGLKCITILITPFLVVLLLVYPEKFLFSLGVQIVAYMLLMVSVIVKYSAFPKEIGLPQAVLCGLMLMFPPAALIIMPIFYKKAKAQLDLILI